MNEYHLLDEDEREELEERLANGCVSRACGKARVDWFNVMLSTGARCVGSYHWASEHGEFRRLKVYRKGTK